MGQLYRLVHYVPCPIKQSQYLIGALLKDGSSVSFIKAKRTPCPACIHGQRAEINMSMSIETMTKYLSNFDEIPTEVGQGLKLSEPKELLQNLKPNNPKEWIKQHILDR